MAVHRFVGVAVVTVACQREPAPPTPPLAPADIAPSSSIVPPAPAVAPPLVDAAVAIATDAPSPGDVCVVDLDVGPSNVAIDGQRARFCFDGWEQAGDRLVEVHPCYAVGLVDGKYTSAPEAARAGPIVKLGGPNFTVCRPDGTRCKTMHSKLLDHSDDPSATVLAEVNDAGTLAAAFDGGSTTRVESYALPTGERLATFTIRKNITMVGVLDETIVAVEMDEETFRKHDVKPAAATLWTKLGEPIGTVGGDTPIPANPSRGRAGLNAVHQRDNIWAFASAAGDRVVLQDIKTGRVAKTIETGARTFPSNVSSVGDVGRVAILFGGGDGQSGEVVVVDLSTDRVTRFKPARCQAQTH